MRRSLTGSLDSSLNNSLGSKLQKLAAEGDRQAKVKMAHYKGTIVAVKLMSSKGATFTRMDELEMTAVSVCCYLFRSFIRSFVPSVCPSVRSFL